MLAAQSANQRLPSLEPELPEMRARGNQTVWIRTALIAILALGAGYASRDLVLNLRTHKLDNVSIIDEGSGNQFIMWTAETGAFHTVFCDPVPFKMGNIIKRLRYEDKMFCWSVKEDGLAYYIDQGGRNARSDPYANAYARSDTHSNPYPNAAR